MPQQALTVVRGDDVELLDDPINPAWVLEGRPRARVCTWVTSADQTASSFVWDCTAGRFRWYFAVDETVTIVDGSVTVTPDEPEGAEPVTLRVGDGACFRAGTWSTWHVEDYVRKHALLRVPVPGPMAKVVNGLGRRAHRLGRPPAR
ncbi:cupin domain-containing protein [Nocardioides sp. SYSU D00038]|uniref:cupin domain-containing protein n=1 Tax=Nocardioides sp. SYSU D00038 TaxID=2812554 RepID=UPI0019689061|nr:cupin domain-containing protein [Nocardioides sp. SYSU D00038]